MSERATDRRLRVLTLGCLLVAVSVTLAACGSSSSNSNGASTAAEGTPTTSSTTAAESEGDKNLIMFALSAACSENAYYKQVCAGVEGGAKKLGPEFEVEIKTGQEFSNNVSYNNLIQTTLQLDPAGLIVFPSGPAAQTPVLNEACDQGVKVVIIDSPASGVKCQAAFIGADHCKLGEQDAKWLIQHPPATKQVGVVSLPQGEYESNDARVRCFSETVEAAGYEVVATALTDLSLDKTRTEVTNMLTAHPEIGAVFSANGPMGEGTEQALKGNTEVVQLSLDGFPEDIEKVADGTVAVNTAQNPYEEGELAVLYTARVIEGKAVPKETFTTSEVVDKTNADEYLAEGGLH